MANLIPIMGRASETDAEGDLVPVTDAVAYFFVAGSTTPLTVYTDSGLGTPRGTSVASDSDGIFPQCWTDQDLIKIAIQDGDGLSLDGFPQDNFPCLPIGGTTATATTFTPVTGNSATNTQTAVANNTGRVNTLDNASRLATSTGSGGTFALTSTYSISAYAAGQEYEFVANQASVGGGGDTLNVDGVGAAVIKKYEGSTTKADLAAGDIAIGDVVRVKHDGTHFAVLTGLTAGEATKGLVEAATTAEMNAATANKFPDAAKVAAYITANEAVWTYGTPATTTSGTEFDWTIPAGVSEIELLLSQVTLSTTDELLVQLGDAGGIETTSYVSASFTDNVNTTATDGFTVTGVASGAAFTLKMTISDATGDSLTWVASHAGRNGSLGVAGGGDKTLSEALTTVRLTRDGTNTFSAGTARIRYR